MHLPGFLQEQITAAQEAGFYASEAELVADAVRTLMAARGRIESAGGYPETAVLHWRPSSSLFPEDEPDHYVEITEDFIHYPWQRIDDSDYRVLAHPVLPPLS